MPSVARPSSRARMTARRAESTRFIWPAPTPTTWSAVVSTIALDLACLATRQAKRSAVISAAVGGRLADRLEARRRRGRPGRSTGRADRPSTLGTRPAPRRQRVARLNGSFEDAALLLRPAQLLERVGREGGREEDLDEDAGQLLHDRHVEGPVDADDAAVDRDRVAGLGPRHRLADVRPRAAPHGLVCLIDDRGRIVELEQQAERRRRNRAGCCSRARGRAAAVALEPADRRADGR